MTIAELHSNEDLRRTEFPVSTKQAYFGHAGVCPLPRRVADAITDYVSAATLDFLETTFLVSIVHETREMAAQLIGGKPDEIAIVGPTSLALSYVAGGLRYKKGQNVLVYFDDYPSNVYPWMALADRGIEVRFINVRNLGEIRPHDVIGQVDEATRLVALASCHYISGFRIDIDAIGKALRERGILFCVDAIQTLGAFPTSVKHVDFLAADAHKWMLGPCGAGILFVRQSVQEQLTPITYGWKNVPCPGFLTEEDIQFRSGARRYEPGTHGWPGIVGMHACLKLLLEVGVENIAAELLRKRAWLVPALQAKEYDVLNASLPHANCGGMISFYRSGNDLAALYEKLTENAVHTTLRVDRSGQNYIRLSGHFYNTDAEFNRMLELL